jgi:tetratricopeptide (TPR) repeat protein
LAFLVIVAAQDRFAIRPELLSFPLLLGLMSILDHGRTRGGRGLWLLVPLMVVWVNVHALFVIGAFAIVCALIGAPSLPSRKLAVSGGLALAAVVINPYGFRGALFPLKLLTRIDGSSPAFQTIAEFRSPFAADAAGASIVAYKLLLIAGSVAAIAALIVNLRRRAGIDLGGLVFFAGLAALSVMARRNAALFAFGCAPFIARSFGTVFAALPARVRDRSRTCAPYGAAVVICAAILAAASVVTGAFYRWDRQSREFGSGVIEGTFPVRAAAFVREAKLPPNLYNDIASGGYLAWDDPLGNGVFIDGRLEVYDTEFFSEYITAMYDQDRWYADADRFGVQTVILYHHWENRRLLVERLVRGGVFWLVYADEVAAVFVRAAGNEQALARAAAMNDRWNRATRDWLERPFAKRPYPAGRVEGTRSFAGLLATVGDPKGAEEAYLKLLELGVTAGEEIETRLLLARRFAATGRIEQARDQARRILTIDPSNQEAQGLLR